MLQNKIFIASISAFVIMIGMSLVLYTMSGSTWGATQTNILELFNRERPSKSEPMPKPILVSVDRLSVDVQLSTQNVVVALTNPTDKHVLACIRGKIMANDSDEYVPSTAYCFPDIDQYSTAQQTLPIHDDDNRILDMCFDHELYGEAWSQYLKDLKEWSDRVDEYKSKLSEDPAYAKALGILSNKKPKPPEKILNWKACHFQLVDAAPVR